MLKVIGQDVFEGQDCKYVFAAVDPDGQAYLFSLGSNPYVCEIFECWLMKDNFDCDHIGEGFYAENWKESLITKTGFINKYKPEQDINTVEIRVDNH